MKKVTILSILLVAFSSGIYAQDYIYLRNKQERIAVKNIQITGTEIKYEKYTDSDEQVYSIKPNQVNLIAFENGEVRLIQREKKIINMYEFKQNRIIYHLFDLVVNNFTISYERILKGGKIGIQIPVSFGYSENRSGFDQGSMINKFYTGVNLNFYPTGQGTIRYIMGPGIRIGMGHNANGYYKNESDSFYAKLLVSNGVIFSPIPSLSLSAVLSLGIRYFPEANRSNDVVSTVASYSMNLSYRF